MAVIMDGKALAATIRDGITHEVRRLEATGVEVGLGILRVGAEPASVKYFEATLRASRKLGINVFEFVLPGSVSLNETVNLIHSVNADERINGLLVLFPLPGRFNARRVVNEILPEKDVDGLGYLSIGRLAAEESTFQLFASGGGGPLESRLMPMVSGFLPCTPYGVIRLLEHYQIPIRGMHAVVLGKSLAVGKPLSMMLLAKEATVTVCHRETRDLAAVTRQADIICSATGVSGIITGDMVKDGAVVIDIGIKVLGDGTITGDVDFASVSPRASYITPVPGGVGPLTIAMLLENTVRSASAGEASKSPLLSG